MKSKISVSLGKIAMFSIVMLLSVSTLQAQAPSKFKKGKVNCTRVWITDPGELYSTYEFSEEELELVRSSNKKITQSLLDEIVENHVEAAWPGNLANLDNRVDNVNIMMEYVTYRVTHLDGKYILLVPASQNKSQASGWIPQHDIYFVIGESGVSEEKP